MHEATFGIGARVKVIRQRKYPAENLKGLIGTVRTDSGTNVSVIFDTIKNPRSQYGCFYFKASELEAVDEFTNEQMEEKNMGKITGYLNCVKVTFQGGDKPSPFHFANFENDLAVGDVCVVKCTNDTLNVVRVAEIIEDVTVDVYYEVVAKVDTDRFVARLEARAKAAELKAKMEARAKQLQDIALYQMLAKDDPDMAALLQEYQGLPKV